MTESPIRLDLFDNPDFDRGASRLTEALWIVVQACLFSTWLPGSKWRRALLRAFGAKIGNGVVIKPHVSIKFPWRLSVGDHSWLGERVWIDNLADVKIGAHSCLSQGAYLCTGSHDWSDVKFALVTRSIEIGDGCWVGARASIAPGARLGNGAIIAMNALGQGNVAENVIVKASGEVVLRPIYSNDDG